MAVTKLNYRKNHNANRPMKNHVNVDEWVAITPMRISGA
jgi:hypothetical protein